MIKPIKNVVMFLCFMVVMICVRVEIAGLKQANAPQSGAENCLKWGELRTHS